MNCRPLPWALRLDRLAGVERVIPDDPSILTGPPQGNLPGRSRLWHGGAAAKGAPPQKEGEGRAVLQVGPIGIRHGADESHSSWPFSLGTGRGLAGLQPDPPLDLPLDLPLDDALSLTALANFF